MHSSRGVMPSRPDRPLSPLNVLVFVQDVSLRDHIVELLAAAGHEPVTVARVEHAVALTRSNLCDVIVTDIEAVELDGLALLATLQKIASHVHGVVIAQRPCVDDAVAATRMGADYITRPVSASRLLGPIAALRAQRTLQRETADADPGELAQSLVVAWGR